MSRTSKRRLISAVALFAMALRLVVAFLFVPAIDLPGAPAAAGYGVVLCTEHGPMQVTLDQSGSPEDDQQDESRPVCPLCYAGACSPFALVPPSTGPLLTGGGSAPLETRAVTAVPLQPSIYAATARGPPLPVI